MFARRFKTAIKHKASSVEYVKACQLWSHRVKTEHVKSFCGLISRYGYSEPGPEVIKLFSYSTQLSMEFFQLINVKMPTIVGILTFMSGKNSIVDLPEPEKC